jgi:hypothetical protein
VICIPASPDPRQIGCSYSLLPRRKRRRSLHLRAAQDAANMAMKSVSGLFDSINPRSHRLPWRVLAAAPQSALSPDPCLAVRFQRFGADLRQALGNVAAADRTLSVALKTALRSGVVATILRLCQCGRATRGGHGRPAKSAAGVWREPDRAASRGCDDVNRVDSRRRPYTSVMVSERRRVDDVLDSRRGLSPCRLAARPLFVSRGFYGGCFARAALTP